MKKYLQIAFVVAMILLSCVANAQPVQSSTDTSAKSFNVQVVKEHFLLHHPDGLGWEEYLTSRIADFKNSELTSQSKFNAQPPSPNVACTNIDFEDGTLNGWSASTGFNPNYNIVGCCATAGGAQTIVTGGGTDACGGFPIVAPGGTYSLLLGNNAVNGVADRVEQTFTVAANNTFFTYRYAVVMQDPGHTLADQPSFQIEMLDGNGNQIPCAQYQVSAGQGIPGFVNSTTCPGVVYKPWSTVTIDLSGFMGQNVTIRFTTYDCALGGHYGYAYLDGSCLQFNSVVNDTICNNGTLNLAGIPGAGSWLWSGPGVNGLTTQNVTITQAGNFNVASLSVTGCPLPNLFYNIANVPAPIASFTNGGNTICNTTVNFTNTSVFQGSNSNGTTYWSFGDGATSFLDNPSHTYASPGTYQVQLVIYSLNGCTDTANATIQILMPMSSSFVYTANCVGSPAMFQDNSFVAGGTINSWQWNFGDGTNSTLQNPNHIYSIAGTYTVILNVSSSNGCVGGDTLLVTINPVPNVNFSANGVCLGSVSTFTNTSTISSGSINSYAWDFNTDGITDNTGVNPVFAMPNSGAINVSLTATSNYNCTANYTGPVVIYPQPIAAYITNNNCFGLASSFTNSTTIQTPGVISNYNWNFGDATNSNLISPNHLYATAGNYNITLTSTSTDGCVGIYNSAISIYPAPTANFSAPNVCFNNATVFTNFSSVATGAITSYNWDFNNDGTVDNTAVNPNFVYATDGTYLVNLSISTNNNCTANTSIPVTVFPLPVVNFTYQVSCLGLPTNFVDVSTVSTGSIAARKWDFNSDGIIDFTGLNPTHIYPLAGLQNPSLQIITNNNCFNGTQKVLYVNPNPQVSFVADDTAGCPSHCVNFTNLSTIQAGTIASYSWNFGGNATSSQVNPQHCFTSGNYNISLTAVSDSGCVTSFTNTNMIFVYPSPQAGFSVNPNDPDVLEPIVNVSDASVDATNWQYNFSDGSTYAQADFQHMFNTQEPQSFTLTQIVWNTYGCYDTATQVIDVKPAYALYVPNAFTPNDDGKNDFFFAQGIGIKEFTMRIFDRWGNMIFVTDDINKGWDGKVQEGHSDEIAQMDVFVWKAEVKDLNNKAHNLVGKVSLVK